MFTRLPDVPQDEYLEYQRQRFQQAIQPKLDALDFLRQTEPLIERLREVGGQVGQWWQSVQREHEQAYVQRYGTATPSFQQISESQVQGLSQIPQRVARDIGVVTSLVAGPVLRTGEMQRRAEQWQREPAGPPPTEGITRFVQRVGEVGLPQAWQEEYQRWEQTPEPFPGVKGTLEAAVPIPVGEARATTLVAEGAPRATGVLGRLGEIAGALVPALRERPAESVKDILSKVRLRPANPEEFVEARAQSARPEFLTPYTPDELSNAVRIALSQDKNVGYALKRTEEGTLDLVNVFNNSFPGAGQAAVIDAVKHGAETLDCFDGFLPKYYSKFGFKAYKAEPWNDAFAPRNWDYEKYGRPDIMYMRYEGGPRETIEQRVGSFPKYQHPGYATTHPGHPGAAGHSPAVGTGIGAGEGPGVGPATQGLAGRPVGVYQEPRALAKAPSSPSPPSSTAVSTAQASRPRQGFAGNIRLEKYPEEVRDIVQQYAEQHADEIETYRRGVRSDEQVMADARTLVEATGGDFNRLVRRWKPGQAWNAEEIAALRGVLRDKTEQVLAAQQALQAGSDTTENLLKLRLVLEEHAAVQNVLHGVTAEAGRALRQFRQTVGEALQSGDTDRIQKALKALGGREVNEQIAKRFSQLVQENANPDAVYSFVRSVTNPKLGDYVTELFYNSILSGPKTHVVNAVSNALTSIMSPLERGFAAAVEVPLARAQGRQPERYLGEATADLFGLIRGIPEGLRAAGYVLKYGYTPAQATKWEFRPRALEVGLEQKFGEMGRRVGRALNLPTTMLEAADQFFKAINYRAALNAEAYRIARSEGLQSREMLTQRIADLLANPTPELMKRAEQLAEYRLFRQEPGQAIGGLTRIRETVGIGSIKPLRFVIPFLRTPTNLLKYGLERTPLAWLNPRLWQHVAAKDAQAADEIARAALGSMLAAGIAWYVADGKITGAAPSNKLERDQFYREGKQPFSVKIGDKWVSYQRLEPFNQVFTQVAAVVEKLAQGDRTASERAMDVVWSIGKNLVSQTYMQSISDILNALSEPERYASDFAERFLTSLAVPYSAALRTAAQSIDTTIREPKGVLEAIQANVPALSQNVPARLTALGEEAQRESPAWSPYSVTTEKGTLLNRELRRLDVDVGFVGESIRGLPLTREEQQEYQRAVGQRRKQFLEQLVAHPLYQQADDATKARLLESALNKVRDDVADLYLRYLVEKLSRAEINERLAKAR